MRICVSILPKNIAEALNLIKKAEESEADLIEVRLDRLEKNSNLGELAKATKLPLIATNKLAREKGFFAGSEAERQQILLSAAENGFEYVDVDLSNPNNKEIIDKIKKLGSKPIVSYHNSEDALNVSEMEKILHQEISCGASVCKIIVTAKTTEDNLTALNFVASHSGEAKLVCFCMSEAGKVSRLLSPMFGAFFTFASLEQGDETAKGQMSIGEMKVAYDLLGAT